MVERYFWGYSLPYLRFLPQLPTVTAEQMTNRRVAPPVDCRCSFHYDQFPNLHKIFDLSCGPYGYPVEIGAGSK